VPIVTDPNHDTCDVQPPRHGVDENSFHWLASRRLMCISAVTHDQLLAARLILR
jgi:hypothetical protein